MPAAFNFYPRSPRGERRIHRRNTARPKDFYPRSPRGERQLKTLDYREVTIFLSTLPARGATCPGCGNTARQQEFLSTLPARGATRYLVGGRLLGQISIHAPREGSDRGLLPQPPRLQISIHAPREGSDRDQRRICGHPHDISIHAPREGSDLSIFANAGDTVTFLSTLPARGATRGVEVHEIFLDISIHAPREGSDCL